MKQTLVFFKQTFYIFFVCVYIGLHLHNWNTNKTDFSESHRHMYQWNMICPLSLNNINILIFACILYKIDFINQYEGSAIASGSGRFTLTWRFNFFYISFSILKWPVNPQSNIHGNQSLILKKDTFQIK